MIVGLANPGARYAGTRHNIGGAVCERLIDRHSLGRAKRRYAARYVEGRLGDHTGPRVAVLIPETFMNESGRAVGPARGELRVPLDRVVVAHDEIDLPFGRIESRVGGGLAGHNGLKSIKAALGDAAFRRVRIGVGRPESSDPETVAAYVLARFRERPPEVDALIDAAAAEIETLVFAIPDDHGDDAGNGGDGVPGGGGHAAAPGRD